MKKGCFLSSIVIFTFVIGIVFYVIDKYGDKFTDYGKEKLIQLAADSIEENINNIERSNYQDSLKIMVSDYIENIDTKDFDNTMNKISVFFKEIDSYIKDNQIDSLEFDILKKLSVSDER